MCKGSSPCLNHPTIHLPTLVCGNSNCTTTHARRGIGFSSPLLRSPSVGLSSLLAPLVLVLFEVLRLLAQQLRRLLGQVGVALNGFLAR